MKLNITGKQAFDFKKYTDLGYHWSLDYDPVFDRASYVLFYKGEVETLDNNLQSDELVNLLKVAIETHINENK